MNPLLRIHKAKLTVGGVILASALTFGVRGTTQHLTAIIEDVRGVVYDHASVDHLIKVGRQQIDEAEERLQDAESAAGDYHKQEERVMAEIAHLQQSASVGRARLETLRSAVSTNGSLQHAGCNYSAATVRQDAVMLATFVKGCDEQVALKQQELKDLHQTLASGDNVLGEARKEFAKAKSRFHDLGIRLQQQQAVEAATTAARAARDGVSAELGGDFAETMSALEKRIRKLQHRNETLRTNTTGVPPGSIPFEPTTNTDAESLINEVLGTAKPAPSTAQVR